MQKGETSGGTTMTTIHIHEDDWGMRNIYPVAALLEADSDMAQSIAFGEKHRAPDGTGWTSVREIVNPTLDFTSIGLRLERAEQALGRHMPRVRSFIATATAGFDAASRDPYGSYEDDAWCFGFDARCYIKLEPEAGLVQHVWFDMTTQDEAHRAAFRRALEAFDNLAEAVIADYWGHAVGRIRDGRFMSAYFDWLKKTATV